MMTVHEPDPEIHARLAEALDAPSLYDEVLSLLAAGDSRSLLRRWKGIDRRPTSAARRSIDAWLAIYRDPAIYWDLYELAEKLVDLEYRFQQWRFSHMKTVERIIGFKSGSGGSSGVAYLAGALGRSFFPELFQVRTRCEPDRGERAWVVPSRRRSADCPYRGCQGRRAGLQGPFDGAWRLRDRDGRLLYLL